MNDRITTQKKLIRAWLESGQSITPMDALLEFGCFRLGARIYDLRREGMNISTMKAVRRNDVTGKYVSYARYILDKEDNKHK